MDTTITQRTENDDIIITKHAEKRIKERLGWSRKTAQRMLPRVYKKGTRTDALKGQTRKFALRHEEHHPGTKCVLYGSFIYVFSNNCLITVLNLKTIYSRKEKEFEVAYAA